MRCFPALERTRTPEKDISFKCSSPVIKILAALYMKWATYGSRSRTAPLSKTGRNKVYSLYFRV